MHYLILQRWQGTLIIHLCTAKVGESQLALGLPLMNHGVLHTQSTASLNADCPLHILQRSQHDKTIATFLWSRNLWSCEKPNSCSLLFPITLWIYYHNVSHSSLSIQYTECGIMFSSMFPSAFDVTAVTSDWDQ